MSEGGYYRTLFSLQSEMKNLNWKEKAIIWNKWYFSLKHPLVSEDLHLALSLVNPAFHFNWEGSPIILSEDGWGAREGNICEFSVISGVECPWNEDPSLRTTMNKDHRWPASLGGPASGFNLLWLCNTHNQAKGNGLWGFDWELVPKWLEGRLIELWREKLLGYVEGD